MRNSKLHKLLEIKHTEKHRPHFNPSQNVTTYTRGPDMDTVKNQNLWPHLKRSELELAFWRDPQKILIVFKAYETLCCPIPNYQRGGG